MTELKWYRDKKNSGFFNAFKIKWSLRGDKLSYPDAWAEAAEGQFRSKSPIYWRNDEYHYKSKKPWHFEIMSGYYKGSIGRCKKIIIDHYSSSPKLVLTDDDDHYINTSFETVELLQNYSGPVSVKFKEVEFNDEDFVLHQNAYAQHLEKGAYVMASIRNYPFIGQIAHATEKKVYVTPAEIYKQTLAEDSKTVNFVNFKTGIIVIDEDIAEETITLCSIGGF